MAKLFNPNDYACLMFPANHPPAWWRDKIVVEEKEPPKPEVSRQPKAAPKEKSKIPVEHLIF